MSRLDRILSTGLTIADTLETRPASGTEIARAAGVPQATADRYLHALTLAGRAHRTRYGWRLPAASELDRQDVPVVREGSAKQGVTWCSW